MRILVIDAGQLYMMDVPRKTCAKRHTWLNLCECGAARVCERCGVGKGTIPCSRCMVQR